MMVHIPLLGARVESLWSLWDEEYDEWFNDAPIVICTKDQQLEFCANKLNEFSFSLNTIDLSTPVFWCGEAEPDMQPLRWVEQRNPEYEGLIGKPITAVETVESYLEEQVEAFTGLPTFILSGIALHFQDECLEILNGLDCNTLRRNKRGEAGLKYTRLLV